MSGAEPINGRELANLIAMTLASNPEYLANALEGVTIGMAGAVRKAEQRGALKDQATLAAMALSSGRVGKELRETLLARVAAAINPTNQCEYERGYIDQYAKVQS